MPLPKSLEYSPTTWRLIVNSPAEGSWNMAVDEALLTSLSAGNSMPILRLYAWNPPCVSLGYAQPILDVDREAVHQYGWHIVRRPTGGRAILHTDELTYAVIAPYTEPRLEGGVLESYMRLSHALAAGLTSLNVHVQTQEQASAAQGNKGPVCFEVPSNYEITFNERKLVGSAQARKKAGILQHGTIPLSGDITRVTKALKFPSAQDREQAAQKLSARAVTIEQALQTSITWDQAAESIIKGFESSLSLRFESIPLTDKEKSLARTLMGEKYAHQAWTERI